MQISHYYNFHKFSPSQIEFVTNDKKTAAEAETVPFIDKGLLIV
jgi:hypothetical protein